MDPEWRIEGGVHHPLHLGPPGLAPSCESEAGVVIVSSLSIAG